MYVLHTGSSWKGRIGRARIVCDLSGLENDTVTFQQRPTHRTGSQAIWELRNLKPSDGDDIWVTWMHGFTDIVVDGVNRSTSSTRTIPTRAFPGIRIWNAPRSERIRKCGCR